VHSDSLIVNPASVSKVVEDNGEPMVMYTGTSADKDFSKFKMPRNGVWFTKWADSASDYAMENDSKGLKYNPDTRRYDDVNSASRVIPVFLNVRNQYKPTFEESQGVNVERYKAAQSKLFDAVRAKGFDGIKWAPPEWVVIGSPNQIKSAIGNAGGFNGQSAEFAKSQPRIIFFKGGHDGPTHAPKGGATSPLNGEFYEGGQFMCNQFAMPKGYTKFLKIAVEKRTAKTDNIANITVTDNSVLIRMAGETKQDRVFSGSKTQCAEFARQLLAKKAEKAIRHGVLAHPTELIFKESQA
jgi:hypothetical protein